MKKLIDYTLPTNGILSITGIPGTYKNLIIYATLKDTSTSNANGGTLTINGLSQGSHDNAVIYGYGQGNSSYQGSGSNFVEYLAPGSQDSNSRGAMKIIVPDYTGTGRKRFLIHTGMAHTNETSYSYICFEYVGMNNSSSAVTSFTLTPQSGASFVAGVTKITIYGV